MEEEDAEWECGRVAVAVTVRGWAEETKEGVCSIVVGVATAAVALLVTGVTKLGSMGLNIPTKIKCKLKSPRNIPWY